MKGDYEDYIALIRLDGRIQGLKEALEIIEDENVPDYTYCDRLIEELASQIRHRIETVAQPVAKEAGK